MIFDKAAVTVLSPTDEAILRAWQEFTCANLWRFSLLSEAHPGCHEGAQTPSHTSPAPKSNSAYGMPRVAALIRYLHAAAGFPVKSTWLAAIKAGNYVSWIGLTHTHANKYFTYTDKTIKGHIVHTRQGLHSTKPRTAPSAPAITPSPVIPEPVIPSGELHIW